MSNLPPNFPASDFRGAGVTQDEALSGAGLTAIKWAALQDAASVVANLAGIEPEQPNALLIGFPATIHAAGGWRRAMAENGIDDMTAFMKPGIEALLSVNARGGDVRAPALALWHEYIVARSSLFGLLPPG